MSNVKAKHSHYYKDVSNLEYVDVYRVLQLFNVTDPCIQHALKKLLVAGGRGAGKDINKDIQESMDSLKRWQEMQEELIPKIGFGTPDCISPPFVHRRDCESLKVTNAACNCFLDNHGDL